MDPFLIARERKAIEDLFDPAGPGEFLQYIKQINNMSILPAVGTKEWTTLDNLKGPLHQTAETWVNWKKAVDRSKYANWNPTKANAPV